VFTFPDKIVKAQAQIIGTFDSQANTWMWAWANHSIASLSRKIRFEFWITEISAAFGNSPHRNGPVKKWSDGECGGRQPCLWLERRFSRPGQHNACVPDFR
jgi:hypothetical protein